MSVCVLVAVAVLTVPALIVGQTVQDQVKAKIEEAEASLAAAKALLEAPPPPPPPPDPVGDSVCGEDPVKWHARLVTRPDGSVCDTGHTHGDPTPAWVAASAWPVRPFSGPSVTEAHTGFVCVEVEQKLAGGAAWPEDVTRARAYTCYHVDSNPRARRVPTHTFQTWILDGAGGVSQVRARLVKGPNIDRDALRPGEAQDPAFAGDGDTRPATFVQTPSTVNHGEQWYPDAAGPFKLAVLILNPTWLETAETTTDPATWTRNEAAGEHPGAVHRTDVQVNGSELSRYPEGAFCMDEAGELAAACDGPGIWPQFVAPTLKGNLLPHFGGPLAIFADTCGPETCDRDLTR